MKEENKNRVMAGVVCYNPDIDTLEKNLNSIVSQADETLIVDNNSANSRDIDKLVSGFNKFGNKRVSILHNPDNYGVSKALNQIMQIAYDGEFEWVLTMDQDTELPESYIKKNLELIINLQDHRIAVVNGQYVEKGRDHQCNQRKKSFSDTDHVITSGSIVSADKWKNVGGFDEKLFIDFADTDFCFKCRENGFRIIQNNAVSFIHSLGTRNDIVLLGKRRVSYMTHSPYREYFMARNAVYFDRKHFGKLTKEHLWGISKQYIKAILLESDKIERLLRITKGIKDGLDMEVNQ